jgi:hypothetical protein
MKDFMIKLCTLILVLLVVLFMSSINFFILSALLWIICFCFNLVFSWKLVIGFWACMILFRLIFLQNRYKANVKEIKMVFDKYGFKK